MGQVDGIVGCKAGPMQGLEFSFNAHYIYNFIPFSSFFVPFSKGCRRTSRLASANAYIGGMVAC